MHIDRKPSTGAEVDLLERLVGSVSTASIAKRLGRPENSVVTKLKRMSTSRRVRNGYTIRELEIAGRGPPQDPAVDCLRLAT